MQASSLTREAKDKDAREKTTRYSGSDLDARLEMLKWGWTRDDLIVESLRTVPLTRYDAHE
jgi:hypothetical protein